MFNISQHNNVLYWYYCIYLINKIRVSIMYLGIPLQLYQVLDIDIILNSVQIFLSLSPITHLNDFSLVSILSSLPLYVIITMCTTLILFIVASQKGLKTSYLFNKCSPKRVLLNSGNDKKI